MKDVKTKADGLLIFLQKEYDIKQENERKYKTQFYSFEKHTAA